MTCRHVLLFWQGTPGTGDTCSVYPRVSPPRVKGTCCLSFWIRRFFFCLERLLCSGVFRLRAMTELTWSREQPFNLDHLFRDVVPEIVAVALLQNVVRHTSTVYTVKGREKPTSIFRSMAIGDGASSAHLSARDVEVRSTTDSLCWYRPGDRHLQRGEAELNAAAWLASKRVANVRRDHSPLQLRVTAMGCWCPFTKKYRHHYNAHSNLAKSFTLRGRRAFTIENEGNCEEMRDWLQGLHRQLPLRMNLPQLSPIQLNSRGMTQLDSRGMIRRLMRKLECILSVLCGHRNNCVIRYEKLSTKSVNVHRCRSGFEFI